MARWSVSSGTQRLTALLRTSCARRALSFCLAVLLASFISALAAAQTRSLPSPPNGEAPAIKAPAAPTPPQESEDLAVALQKPGDLNLHGLSLNAAMFTIGEQWNINIVAGDLQGNVNGVFKQAPLREILDAILLSNGYNYRAVGKSLVISTVADLGQVNPFFQSATIPVQTADIDEVVEGAQLLTTPKGQVRALKSAHSIVVLDFPDRVKMIRDFIATLESTGNGRFPSAENRGGVPLEVGYFRTQHITAKAAEQALQAVLSKEGRVAVMELEDRLLVTDYAENLAMAEKVLARVDHPRPQVRIVALIYDISLQDIEQIGINWNPTFKARIDGAGNPQTSLEADSVTKVPFGPGAVGNTLTFINLSQHVDLTTVARCVQTAKDARLLADPNIAVLENEEAILENVEEIPYQQLTQTQQGGNIGTTAFKKAGITLRVKPKIAADGIIRMEVRPEASRLTGFTPGDNQPIIATNSATTTLTVANRQLVVIGGLRQRQDIGDFTGVPYLKDLKLVGRLFRSRNTEVRESELVVFLMPEIIPYGDDPTCRQKAAAETIGCRLDQVPVAEGCPPCCRRLPDGTIVDMPYDPNAVAPMMGPPVFEAPVPAEPSGNSETLPAPSAIDLPAEGAGAAAPVRSPAMQGPASNKVEVAQFEPQIRDLAGNGQLRRLPAVPSAGPSPVIGTVAVARMFKAPVSTPLTPQLPADEQLRAAELPSATPVRR